MNMITEFKIFEKSILTNLGIPDNVMKRMQKSFQIKYVMPEKVENPTKIKIKELSTDLIGLVLKLKTSVKEQLTEQHIGG